MEQNQIAKQSLTYAQNVKIDLFILGNSDYVPIDKECSSMMCMHVKLDMNDQI